MKKRMHPNSLKNLRPPIKKGEVLNPTGRPRGSGVVSECLRALLTEIDPTDPKKRTRALRLAQHILARALSRDQVLAILLDRVEGRPCQPVILERPKPAAPYNLDALNDNEVDQLEEMVRRMRAMPGQVIENPKEVIEIKPEVTP